MADNYILLERVELNASAASISFNNIPQTGYTDLKIVMSARLDVNDVQVKMQFNSDTTSANYSWRRIYGDGAAATSDNGTNLIAGSANGANSTTSTFGNMEWYIPNYTSSNKKSVSSDQVTENNATTAYTTLSAFLWQGTAAINQITLSTNTSGNFVSGSTFSLYGIAALGTTPVIAPKAIGGNRIDNDGTYWYHTFTSSGTFAPLQGITADVLMVSGGGGGSNNGGVGSGGGGGALYYSAANLFTANTSVPITVGAGGPRDTTSSGPGGAGSLSQFSSTSVSVSNGATGGSGIAGNGGASKKVISGTTTNYTGGSGTGTEPNRQGGGGAGAGANGSNASGAGTMTGGAGLNTYSGWASATGTGVSGYYGGGGGGGFEGSGTFSQASGGAGGGGGGGAGTTAPLYNAGDGVANTGGGGGGCGGRSGVVGGASGNGGSGIVIIRYPIAS